MKPERRNAMMFRFSRIITLLTILGWEIWYLVAGSIPAVKDLPIFVYFGRLTVSLPRSVPHWALDIPFVSVWTIIIIYCLTHPRISEVKENFYHWTAGLIIGLIVGIPCALIEELGFGLGFALIYAALSGLIFILPHSLGFCIGIGLVFGVVWGMGFGLIALAIVGAGLLIGPPIRVFLIYVFSPAPWLAFGHWLMAKDKE